MKCIVCGQPAEWVEPRFGYYACHYHTDIPPALIDKYRELNGTSQTQETKERESGLPDVQMPQSKRYILG